MAITARPTNSSLPPEDDGLGPLPISAAHHGPSRISPMSPLLASEPAGDEAVEEEEESDHDAMSDHEELDLLEVVDPAGQFTSTFLTTFIGLGYPDPQPDLLSNSSYRFHTHPHPEHSLSSNGLQSLWITCHRT